MASLEASPHYIIYFDNVRVDEFVKSWTVNLSCNGNIGTADIEFVYLPELAYTAASVEDINNSESIMRMLGVIDNMTNVKIFVKNIFSQKYQLIFDGNIKGKSSSRSPGGNSLVFRATDYMAWTNRTIAPIVIPYTQSTHPSDKFIWEAQGIDVSKVMDVSQRDIIGFKGKRLEEIINTVVTQALAANKIYSDNRGVAYWDGIWDRMDLMADIDSDILNKNVLDYIVSPNQGNVDTMYVLLNDIFAKLMFEFYQDRDGVIRIKPPYWNEPVLKSHIIDPSLILHQSENTDYDKYISRVVITGGLDENFQTAGDYATKLWTPTGAYLSDGTWETVKKSDKYVYGWGTEGESTSSTTTSDNQENDVSGGSGSATSDFDYSNKKNGNVYKRKDGSPIVGFGNPSTYGSTKGNGVWWPSIGDGVRGQVQHLSSYYRKKLVSGNKCVDPRFGGNSKLAKTVKGLTGTWASNSRYANNIMSIINKMLGTNLSDTPIGTDSKSEYDKIVTSDRKKKIKDYFVKTTQGKSIKLTSNITREQFINHYFEKCAEELIYPEVAIAQMCEETGYLTFKGSAVYQQNNYAGIGSTDGGNYTTASDWYWPASSARTALVDTSEDSNLAVEYTRTSDAAFRTNDVSVMSRTRSGTKPKYVIIDAGHGAGDSGTSGVIGDVRIYEKDVNLALERMVVKIINNNANGKTVAFMSRTDDKDIGSVSSGARLSKLKEDVKKRGHNISDYCIVSVHANSASSSSASGYYCLTDSASGNKSKTLASEIGDSVSKYVDHYFWGHNKNPRRTDSHTGTWGLIKEKDWAHGGCIIETFFMSNSKDMALWKKDGFPEAMAAGIAAGVMKFMNMEIKDTTVNNDFGATDSSDTGETENWGSANTGQWSGSTFKADLDWDDVDFSVLLSPTHDEMRYGGTVAQIEQPLIKFSNAGAYYDMQGEHNADANEVLKAYAKFYMNMNNSMINTSSVTLIGCPWLRPGFNVWVDPAYTDKVYYTTGITHSGSASGGVTTTLQLIHGRHRTDFVKDGDSRGFGALSTNDDNIFTKNEYFKSAKHFGPVLDSSSDYTSEKKNLINIMKSCKDKGIIKAERSPYAAYYASDYGDSFLKTPTILKVNDAGKQIFTDEEWKLITGRSEIVDTAITTEGEGLDESSGGEATSRMATRAGGYILKRGDSGEEVKTMQAYLNSVNSANIQEDGSFGSETEIALKNYQLRKGLDINGIYDSDTKSALEADAAEKATKSRSVQSNSTQRTFVNNGVLKKGKKGAKIKELQTHMNEFMDRKIITGHKKLAIDGSFGPLTDAVVRAYQKAKKIVVDGMVGPITTANINKDLNSDTGSSSSNSSSSSSTGTSSGLSNTSSQNAAPKDEQSAAKGRISGLLFTDQYTASQIDEALKNVYKQYAPGVVKQRMHIIEKGIISARKTAESTYLNNNYNK